MANGLYETFIFKILYIITKSYFLLLQTSLLNKKKQALKNACFSKYLNFSYQNFHHGLGFASGAGASTVFAASFMVVAKTV